MADPSGYYYPNTIARIAFEATRDLIGAEAMTTLLREQGLEQYIQAFPPDNLQRQFDFVDFAALMAGIDALQVRQPRTPSLAWQIGARCYSAGLKTFGTLSGFGAVALGFQALPLNVKIKMGLLAMVTIFSTLSDQLSDLEDHDDHFAYVIRRCPICMGRGSEVPMCEMAGAMIEEGLYWLTQSRYSVIETCCHATGDDECRFVIDKTPLK